jgi:hypothetical protein
MANADSPFGLIPIRYVSGAPYNGAANVYSVLDTEHNLGVGSVVSLKGTAVDGVAQVQRATVDDETPANNTPIVGVIVGVVDSADGTVFRENDRYIAASTNVPGFALVADDPALLFKMQEDGDLGNAGVGAHFNIEFSTFDTVYGQSKDEIDSSTLAASDTQNAYNLKVLRLFQEQASNSVGTNAVWECMIVNHALRPGGRPTSA